MRFLVDRFSKGGEPLVGFTFFVERRLKQVRDFCFTESLGERARRSICGDFVVLHALRCSDEFRVADCVGRIFFDRLLALFNETLHRVARFPLGGGAENLEATVKAVHMVPAAAGGSAAWESFWASLTFELPAAQADAR